MNAATSTGPWIEPLRDRRAIQVVVGGTIARLLDQLELTLEELEISATEDELAAEIAAAKTTTVASFTRRRPSHKPFPEHQRRERVIVPGPTACNCCG